jgi:salicylate hydroxylase
VEDFIAGVEAWKFDWLDVPAFFRAAEAVLEYPMVDKDPLPAWSFGRVTLLGDAAHPTLQYLAQGACMAMEDAVTLGEALRVHANDFGRAFDRYQRSRVARTARIVLSAREMGRIFHAKGVERLVRNELWKGRSPERFYDALEWLYDWKVDNCLADGGGSR